MITGKDGEVRGVSIQVMSKGKPFILNRPIQKVYPLEISNTLNFDCVTNEGEGTEKKQVVKDKENKAGSRPFFNIHTIGEIPPAGPTLSPVVTVKIRKIPQLFGPTR